MFVVKLYSLHSLLPPGGEGAVQTRSCPVGAQHGRRGVVYTTDTITPSNLSIATDSCFLVQQAAVEHSVPGGWKRVAAPPLATPAHLGRATGLDRHGDGYHHGDGGWDQ